MESQKWASNNYLLRDEYKDLKDSQIRHWELKNVIVEFKPLLDR